MSPGKQTQRDRQTAGLTDVAPRGLNGCSSLRFVPAGIPGILLETPEQELRLFPTEAAAKKAGLKLSSFSGERLSTTLYAFLPEGEAKPTYLLSSASKLTVAERRWAEVHSTTIIKLGRFPAGGSFMPLQRNTLRPKKTAQPQEKPSG